MSTLRRDAPAMFKSDAMGWAVLAAPKRTSVHQSTSVRMTKNPQGVRYALQKVSPLGHRKSADDSEKTQEPSAPLPPPPAAVTPTSHRGNDDPPAASEYSRRGSVSGRRDSTSSTLKRPHRSVHRGVSAARGGVTANRPARERAAADYVGVGEPSLAGSPLDFTVGFGSMAAQ